MGGVLASQTGSNKYSTFYWRKHPLAVLLLSLKHNENMSLHCSTFPTGSYFGRGLATLYHAGFKDANVLYFELNLFKILKKCGGRHFHRKMGNILE